MAYFARVPAGTTRHLPMRQEQEPMLRLVARVLTRSSFLKRFSVATSLVFGMASLVLGACMGLNGDLTPVQRRRLQIASLIINFIALTLATLTSLDWRTQKTQDHQFAARLGKVAPNVHIADSVNWGRAPRDGADFV